MGHISHEDTLHATRVIGTLRLALQLFLFLHQLVDVTPYAEGSFQIAMLVVFRNTVNLYPLGLYIPLGHHWMHAAHIAKRFGNHFGRMIQIAHKLIFLTIEDTL